ncbi:hypothetical protein LVD17_09870 [Fulvivirga ulvae]|uniref:RHS repeat-associated core domain-containing protein n=1 Tax=Fulvivirga ulvae TaxID=2904245 RepID=UPI001F48E400|nr:RHS repeat-associated core domain-containing protein [Fulvivirga ulvae]UII34120.1 hypothetical protein LVD17_09870 [Fulvivirga ulvae]
MYFDDFEVTLTEGKVVQSNNYYPFGLQQNTSWTRMDQTPNAHKFNAATEYNDFTDTYDTPFRQYDPATGRFNGVDALAHMTPTLTPYRFGFNNPVSFNDPTGLNERPVELDDPNLRSGGGGSSIISGADNVFGMSWLSGSMGRAGVGSWTNQYRTGRTQSLASIITSLMIRKGSGGTWTPEGGNSFFQSDNEAIGAGYSYMVRHGASGGSLREHIGKALGGELASDGTFYQFVQTAQYSTDGRMKGAGYVIEQKINLNTTDPVLPNLTPWYDISSWKLAAWSIGLDIDVVLVYGGDTSPIAYGTVLAGADEGKGFLLSDAGTSAFGLDASGAVEGTAYFYTGDINNFTVSTLAGPRFEANLGGSFGIDLGAGIAISERDQFGGQVVAVKIFGGLGIPTYVGGNINWGDTYVQKVFK